MKFVKIILTTAVVSIFTLPAMAGNSHVLKKNSNENSYGCLNMTEHPADGQLLLARGGGSRGGGAKNGGAHSGFGPGDGAGRSGNSYGPGDGSGRSGTGDGADRKGQGLGPGDGTGNDGNGPKDGSGNGLQTGECDPSDQT